MDGDMSEASPTRSTTPHAEPARGRLKVFLGMAAEVGKTYRMLQDGQVAAEGGRDVVVGLLETHGREETAIQAEGLELPAGAAASSTGAPTFRRWICPRSWRAAPRCA